MVTVVLKTDSNLKSVSVSFLGFGSCIAEEPLPAVLLKVWLDDTIVSLTIIDGWTRLLLVDGDGVIIPARGVVVDVR